MIPTITFKSVTESKLADFKKNLQAAFSLALSSPHHASRCLPIPPDDDIEKNYYQESAVTYNVYKNNQHIGGVMLTINPISNHNHLDFFFIHPEYHGKGIGYEVWRAIEEKYSETEIWETGTPYFEKRNIHFYVNKCGFQINAFYCEYHPDPYFIDEERHQVCEGEDHFDDGFFNFIKVMKTP